MGLRYASSRHPNVVVMAPALTETAQTQNFQFASSLSLALKENIKRREVNIFPDVISHTGMNGHSPSKTYSINGIVKNLKSQEFLHLQNRSDGETEEGIEKIPQNLLNHVGGLMMSNSFQETSAAMGLQKSNKGDIEKPAEMDQMFKNLANEDLNTNELGQNVEEILEAISSIENNVQTGGESMFEFEKDLFDVDVMNMCVDESLVAVNKDTLIKERIEEARTKQFMIARKCEFLARRLKKLEARALGKHVADEITGLIEYSTFLLELQSRGRIEGTRPLPLSTMSLFMRQMDHASTQQASALSRLTNKQFKYFGSGSSNVSLVSVSNGVKTPIAGSIMPAYSTEVVQEMDTVAGELHTQLYKAHKDIDSDITESSSGGESADELIPYSNQYQHPLSISKRCKWRWLEDRAAVASRCTWLQSQIADLDYRIRQHNEIKRQVRANKGAVKLEPPSPPRQLPNGWPSDKAASEERSSNDNIGFIGGCARTRPISKLTKRKILQLSGLHRLNKKAARPTTLRCSCRGDTPGIGLCALCTGRQEPTLPRDPLDIAPLNERVALVDSAFHPVLSFNSDISLSVHYDAVMKCSDWQVKASRISSKTQIPGPTVVKEEGEENNKNLSTNNSNNNNNNNNNSNNVSGIVRITSNQPVGRPRKITISGSSNSSNFHPTMNTSSDNVKHDGGLLPDHHLDLQRSKAAAHAVSVKLRRKITGGKRRRKNNIPLERFRHRRKHPGTYSADGELVVEGTDVNTSTSDGSRYPSSPVPSPASVHGKDKESVKRKRENSYDIDNIVIPYSMASSTRLEKLNYKEILTPKWRFVKEVDHKNGIVRRSSQEVVEGVEDLSEETFMIRHNQAEEEERKKFLSFMRVPNSVLNSFLGTGGGGGSGRGRGHRRADSRAESFGPNTPDPMSPGCGENSMTSPPATPQTSTDNNPSDQPASTAQQVTGRRRTTSTSKLSAEQQSFASVSDFVPEVLHYEPRIFPLSEDVFNKMLVENSDNSPQGCYPPLDANYFQMENIESPPSVSTDSAESMLGEDPNDPEWTGFGGKNNVKR